MIKIIGMRRKEDKSTFYFRKLMLDNPVNSIITCRYRYFQKSEGFGYYECNQSWHYFTIWIYVKWTTILYQNRIIYFTHSSKLKQMLCHLTLWKNQD